MTTSILLRSPSPSPSPTSTPLPALQTDLSSSSSSASGSCPDLRSSYTPPSSRRIRFAPLPDPRRDLFDSHDPSSDDPQWAVKPAPQPLPAHDDLPDHFVAISPSISPVSTLSSTRSTPTIRTSHNPSKNTQKSGISLLRSLSFLRHARSSSPIPQSDPLPDSRTRSSSSLPSSPSFHSPKLPRFSTEDILSGPRSLFRPRSGSASSARSSRPSSPPPKIPDHSKHLYRSTPLSSGPAADLDMRKHGLEGGSSQSHNGAAITTPGQKKRRASSSAFTPGAGGGRHGSSVRLPPNEVPRPSTAPSSPATAPKKHVKMLNGRIYGGKRYAAQTLANPFANVRDEPEFVEWGYGGMGSVHASAGIANDMWKGLQRSERGSALLAGSSFGSRGYPSAAIVTAGGGRGSGASASSPIARRKMSDSIPECGMGNVGTGNGLDEDDGSGMGWVKRRRAEREEKARLEQEAKELDKKPTEGRRSGESMDASMYASTASTTTLTVCTSAASTNLTTPATSPLTSRSPSLIDLNSTSSPPKPFAAPSTMTGEQGEKPVTSDHLVSTLREEHDHHVLTAVRLSPVISTLPHKRNHSATHGHTPSLSHTLPHVDKDTGDGGHEQMVPLSPVDTEETSTSTNSPSDGDEPNQGSDDDGDDDEEEEIQDTGRKTALGAGVEKISRHVDVGAQKA